MSCSSCNSKRIPSYYLGVTALDYVFLITLAAVLPACELLFGRPERLRASCETSAGRRRTYIRLLVFEMLIVGSVAAIWIVHGRDWRALGFVLTLDLRFWLGLLLTAVIIAAMALQYSMLLRTPESRAKIGKQITDAAPFAPRDQRDMRWWCVLSVAAGVCEEIVYRGFVFWCGRELIGDSASATAAIIVAAAIIFMLAHTYQGKAGMPQVFVVGLITGGVFVLSQSLLTVIILHIVMDVAAGVLAIRVWREQNETD